MKGRTPNGKDNWRTPPELFNPLDDHFHFTVDAAADPFNALCNTFYTEWDSAFDHHPRNQVIFCNPPFSNKEEWIDLCIRWAEHNRVVLVLPASTSETWFSKVWEWADEVVLLTGRVAFLDENNVPGKSPPGGTALAVFNGCEDNRASLWRWKTSKFSDRIVKD